MTVAQRAIIINTVHGIAIVVSCLIDYLWVNLITVCVFAFENESGTGCTNEVSFVLASVMKNARMENARKGKPMHDDNGLQVVFGVLL